MIEDEVRAAYRWILGREADAAGLSGYSESIRSGQIAAENLRQILLDSPEFAGQQPSYAVVDIGDGIRAVVDPHEPEFGRHIVGGGGWEPHIVKAIRSLLSKGDSFIDVGGNVGVMSFHAARAVGPHGKVIAFEPNMRNVAAFRRGIVANGFDHVTVFPFALSDRRQMIGLTGASNAKVIGEAQVDQTADIVQAVTADEILRHESRVDLVKMDVEGFELQVLRGMADTLARHRPAILCEFNPVCLKAQGGIDPRELAEHLFALAGGFGHLIEHDHSRTRVVSADQLMSLWRERDAVATRDEILPAGWLHFDILFDPRASGRPPAAGH